MHRPLRLLVGVAAGLALAAAPAGAAVRGELDQLTSLPDCWSLTGSTELGAGTCSDARGLGYPKGVVVSPDGRNVYVSTQGTGAAPAQLDVFSRDVSTGRLSQLPGIAGCVSGDGKGEGGIPDVCGTARTLTIGGDGDDIVVSADGRFVYAASDNANSIVTFARNTTTGALSQLAGAAGCVTRDAVAGCADGRGLDAVNVVRLTPDGTGLIAMYYGTKSGLAVFDRGTDGVLTQLPGTQGCLSGDGSSEDGPNTCANIRSDSDGDGVEVSPDGRFVYAMSYGEDGVTTFARDRATNHLTQLAGTAGCITNDGSSEAGAGTCASGRGLDGAWTSELSADGSTLYVGTYNADGLAVFRRDESTGVLTQLPGSAGCLSTSGDSEDGPGTCTDITAIEGTYHLVASADGRDLYVLGRSTKAITAFARNPGTGELTQLPGTAGCTTLTGAGGSGEGSVCRTGFGLDEAYGLALAPNDRDLYVAGEHSNALTTFTRQLPASCTDATAGVVAGGTVTLPLTCTDPDGDALTRVITEGPSHGTVLAVDSAAGTATYRAATGFAGDDVLHFAADDGAGAGPPASVTVHIAPGPPAGTAPRPAGTAPDHRAPHCIAALPAARTSARTLLAGRLRIVLRCDEAATVRASLTARRTEARKLKLASSARAKTITLASTTARAVAGRKLTVTVRAGRKLRRRLRHAGLRRLRGAGLAVAITATDPAGNHRVVRRAVKLRR